MWADEDQTPPLGKAMVQQSFARNPNPLQKILFPFAVPTTGKKEFLKVVMKNPTKGGMKNEVNFLFASGFRKDLFDVFSYALSDSPVC